MTPARMKLQAGTAVGGLAFAVLLGFAQTVAASEIVYWSMWNEQEPNAKVITELAQKYMESHPGTKIAITWNGRQNQVKVRTALNGGTAIDLIDGELDNLAGGVVAAGDAVPFDSLLDLPGPDGKAHFRDLFLPKIFSTSPNVTGRSTRFRTTTCRTRSSTTRKCGRRLGSRRHRRPGMNFSPR